MLPRCHEGCVLEKTSLSSGKIVTGGSFAVGYRDTRISRSGYVDKLKWIDQRYVVFWDEESKRGWLVNGTTTLLHLLRASLEHDSTDKFSSIFLFKPEQMKEAFEPYIAGSAIKVLLDPENLALRIYPDKKDYIRFEHRVDHFYDVLEQMMDYQYYRLSTADKDKGNLNFMPRTYLEGWNFEDLARGRDPLCPRVTKLRTYGKSWVDFTRDIHAVTLFGKGFGEIIRPTAVSSCAYWAKLPEQKYYLAAGVSDLREIMAHHGGDEEANPVQLTDSTIWHNPGSTFELCRCTEKTREEHSDFTQVLLPLTFREKLTGNIPVPMNDHAAVVFGYSSKFRWLWNDSGDPEEGEPPSPSTESETNFHDSGIGRSPTLSTVLTLQNESLTPNHYKVGIVCALHSELLAVRALFDITHENLNNLDIPSQDPNHYVLGRIGLHNVVAAGLPFGEYGTNSAAVVVTHMKRSFPELEYCLLVGIGGGAPSEKHDIRLGDIVVSKPTDTYPGVIQYDLGKTHENGVFELTGSLQRPPAVLMTAITSLLADPNPSPAPLQSYLKDIKMRWPGYKHPGPKDDILFATETVHDSRYETCKQCYGPRISRIYRPHNHPRIHYGLIASGNQVMKSAKIRDRLRDEHDILCFEMEAAGVMNTIPCLVIRGICDYADSHKNKSWQGYAAAAAAAYAKLLLTAVRNINSLESTPAGLETVNKNHHKKRGLAFRESLLAKKSRKT
jgi:nucleoside phosphorylase